MSMTPEQIVEDIGNRADQRRQAWCEANPHIECPPFALDFLSSEEKAELHQAKLQLPSTGELAEAARQRLLLKRQQRRASK